MHFSIDKSNIEETTRLVVPELKNGKKINGNNSEEKIDIST